MVTKDAKAHVPELIRKQDIAADVGLRQFNRWLAVRLTSATGSMWCAYAFCLLALISLPAAILSGSPLIIISWIAQTFLQLVLLPVIMVGDKVNSEVSDKRAEADHATLTAMKTLINDIHERVS